MSGILGSIWSIASTYRPNAARQRKAEREAAPIRFGAFEATYKPPGLGIRPPKNDAEAQRLYNHVRTVAFWLDSAPVLADLGLPFRAGLDDIISLVPIYGDIVSGILQLYQVYLAFLFGVSWNTLGMMLLNVVLDVVVGFVPLVGDFLDNLFKSNLRNLALLETYLLEGGGSKRYHVLLMPEGHEFLPRPAPRAGGGGFSSWFGGGSSKTGGIDSVLEEERQSGRVKKTRRMGRDEGDSYGAAQASPSGTSSARGTRASAREPGVASGTRTRRSARNAGEPVIDPLD